MPEWTISATPPPAARPTCPTRSDRDTGAAEFDRPLAESAIIHEFLHTLGLGEDPPSSREISSRVMRQCFF
jgi:hypothetical protein